MSKKDPTVKHVKVGIQAGTTNTAYATWDWNKKNVDCYKYKWKYRTDNGKKGKWFSGSDGSTTYKDSTYTIPDNALEISFSVIPISKKHNKKVKKGKKTVTQQVSYWDAGWSTAKHLTVKTYTPIAPSAPSVTLDNLKLKMEVDVSSSETEKIEFNIIQDDTKSLGTHPASVKVRHAYLMGRKKTFLQLSTSEDVTQ